MLKCSLGHKLGHAIVCEIQNTLKEKVEVVSLEWDVERGFKVTIKDGREVYLRLTQLLCDN